jgi:hypothetical protein
VSLTDFRQNLQNTLETAMSIHFVAGVITTARDDRDIGCVWIAGIRPWGQDGLVEEIVAHARVFTQFEATQGFKQGDIAQLEGLAETFQTALKAVRQSAGPWTFNVTEIALLLEEHGVEATITAFQGNLAT